MYFYIPLVIILKYFLIIIKIILKKKINLNEGLKLIKKDFNKKDKLILIGHFNEPINLSGFKDVEICFVGNEPIIKKINKTSKLKLAKYILNN